jgi:hypothetical protein
LTSSPFVEFLDYRRTVAEIYADLRRLTSSEAEEYRQFRRQRDALFSTHPQSALLVEQKAQFTEICQKKCVNVWPRYNE